MFKEEKVTMQFKKFLELAKEYDNMGWAVREQLDGVLAGEDLDDQNEFALEIILRFLRHADGWLEFGEDEDGSESLIKRISTHLKAVNA